LRTSDSISEKNPSQKKNGKERVGGEPGGARAKKKGVYEKKEGGWGACAE